MVAEMTMEATLGDGADEFVALQRAFPLVRIRDDAHMDAAMAVIWRLLEKPARSNAEEEYLNALTDLVETYEDTHVHIPERAGLDMLRYLVAENGLKQADLVPIFGAQSIASDVLAGKRKFTLDHMRRAATYFGVTLATFTAE